MAIVCPPQSLCEAFSTDFDADQDLSFYEPRDIKLEKVQDYCSVNSQTFMENSNSSLLDLSSDKSHQFSFKQELPFQNSPQGDLLSWTQKHPDHWSKLEVLDWVYYIADFYQLDGSKFRGENYQNLTGSMLRNMGDADFQKCDPDFGYMFYDIFQQLKGDSRFAEPSPVDYNTDPDVGIVFTELAGVLMNSNVEEMDISELSEQTSKMLDNNLMSVIDVLDGVPKVNIGGTWYDFEGDLSKFDIPTPIIDNHDHGYGSGDSDINSEPGNDHSRLASISSDFYSDDESILFTTPTPTKKKTVNRKRTVSSTSIDEGCEVEEKKSNRGRKQGQSSKGNHLWEFIRDLLKDTSLNPQLLRWEDKDAGVFRFVQSEAVAQMWGRKKNNPCMTYEKLSRAMRFCRSAGYFADVPKNGKYPKKLCFRFGPKASGWQDI